MGINWIYILKCENDIYYVGNTERLYRRFWEHNEFRGGTNTFIYRPIEIVSIYKVETICKFINYNNMVLSDCCDYNSYKLKIFNEKSQHDCDNDKLYAENNIAECMMIHNKDNWKNIRGGKYVRFDCEYKFPINEYIKQLPLCKCGLPCDIKKEQDKNNIFFRCAKKNMWSDLKQKFDIESEPCNFYKEYITDSEDKMKENENFNERKNVYKKLIRKSNWLHYVSCEEDDEVGHCVSCEKYVWCDSQGNFKKNGVLFGDNTDEIDNRRLLCINCFIDKNEELKKMFDPFKRGICLIPNK